MLAQRQLIRRGYIAVAVADLATSGGKRRTAIFPRTGRRAAFTARRACADEHAVGPRGAMFAYVRLRRSEQA